MHKQSFQPEKIPFQKKRENYLLPFKMVAPPRLELGITDPESVVLPITLRGNWLLL